MLVYLDTAQFAWLERASGPDRARFVSAWRELKCELAVSLEILQEVQKRGTPEDVSKRLSTLLELQPLRGIPTGSAGVMIREITDQIRRQLGTAPEDSIASGRIELFPRMPPHTLIDAMADHSLELGRFNLVGQAQAELQANARGMPPFKKGVQADPALVEELIRTVQKQILDGVRPNPATAMFVAMGERVIEAIRNAEEDLAQANIDRFGISDLACLRDLDPEDYSKAAGFVEAAREFAEDIASAAETEPATVLGLVNELRPYDAPGYSIEMAVARARRRHSLSPNAADQVDEEHVSFAPYVELLFVDKRTNGYVEEELRRRDGRIAYDPSLKLAKARDLEDVLKAIRAAERQGQQ